MHLTPRHASPATTVLCLVALGFLAVGVLVAEAVVLDTAGSMAHQYPEFAHLEGPLIAAAIAFGGCVEAVLLITALLVGAIHHGRIFDEWASKLVDVLVVVLVVATAIIAAVLPAIPGPPALGLAVLGGALTGTALVLVVLVLRSLLREAASMRLELAEVV